MATPTTKASVPEVKAYFNDGDSGKAVTARDLIDLKKSPGVAFATAYDDLAEGIGNGSFTY